MKKSATPTASADDAVHEKVLSWLLEDTEALESMRNEVAAIQAELSLQKKRRRYSDQFKLVPLDRLSKELDANRKARLVLKFREDHQDIVSVTEEWRAALISAFGSLASLCSETETGSPEELYQALSLQRTGVTKEELGIE